MQTFFGIASSSKKGAPDAPTIGTATNIGTGRGFNDGAASVSFTPAGSGAAATSYTVLSSGGQTSTSTSSPITVTGLASNTNYTFSVRANNAAGASSYSNSTSSILITTVPQAPTLGSVTRQSNTSVSIPWSDGANGGSSITSRTVTSNPSISLSYSISGTPVTVSGSFAANTSYTFNMTSTNANGTSGASGASNSVTPYPYTPPPTPVITSITYTQTGTYTGVLSWTGTNIDSVLFAASPDGASIYPAPYNYGAFTSGWTGNLVNVQPGQAYTGSLTPSSAQNVIGSAAPFSFTQV